MFRDFRDDAGPSLQADVCIIGGGAAGITLALRLARTRLRVLVVESGGFEPNPAVQQLYAGTTVGDAHVDLAVCRLRQFGGSTMHWEGHATPLTPIDFAARPWLPLSGWPISRDALAPYVRSACEMLDIGPAEFGPAVFGSLRGRAPEVAADRLRVQFWRWSRSPPRFGRDHRRALERAENVTVLLNANAVALHAAPNANAIVRIELRGLAGKRAEVEARAYVLAVGGMENARLLLASNDVEPAGIGNRHDWVGRCYMGHPSALLARGLAADSPMLPDLHRHRGAIVKAGFALADSVQQAERTLNPVAFWKLGSEGHHRRAENRARGRSPAALSIPAELWCQAEQPPDPANRIVLGSEVDALGMRRIRLEWRVGAETTRSAAVLLRHVAAEFARLGLARVQVADWLLAPGETSAWHGNSHHLGTTRMSADPRHGVVDRDLRVHGYANLYIAGSSVFPTGGFANPTLTILALSLRLSEHLQSQLT